MPTLRHILAPALATCLVASPAAASVILSPVAVLSNTAGRYEPMADIDSTIDQSGLSSGFVSGVTDFSSYLATGPTHEWIYTDGSEWFSSTGLTSGTIVYDLGAVYTVTQLALWNEEFSGISRMQVETSTDAAFGSASDVGTFAPTDTPFDAQYGAEVFGLTPSVARYVRLTLAGPQQPNRGTFLSMGEIAFDVTSSDVPEPFTASLLLVGMSVAAARRLRSRR